MDTNRMLNLAKMSEVEIKALKCDIYEQNETNIRNLQVIEKELQKRRNEARLEEAKKVEKKDEKGS